MAVNNPFQNLPAISFANCDVTALTNEIVTAWQSAWFAETGETLTLGPADRRYHFLLSLTSFFLSAFEQLDIACKQNLLSMAVGGFLDQDTTIYGSRALRLAGVGATVPLTFSLVPAVPLTSVFDIPAGTLVASSASDGNIFATNADLQIPIGQLSGTVDATCTTIGVAGNGLPINVLTNLVVSNPALSVTNPEPTVGGADTETDDAYRVRIYGPTPGTGVVDSYTTTGSYGAYTFWAESADPSISDVSVAGPESGLVTPGQVLISVLCDGGTMPNTAILNAVYAEVSPLNRRDLCAQVFVQPPTGVPVEVTVNYYVPENSANNLIPIQAAVNAAVNGWITGVTTVLAANIDPSALEAAVYNAGAVQVTVTQPPAFSSLALNQVAILVNDPAINYQGLC